MSKMELLDQIEAETATNPEWFGMLVSIGTDHMGISEGALNRVWSTAAEARALAGDASETAERRDAHRRIGEPMDDVILGLALVGQQVVNQCTAIAAAERVSVSP